MLTYFMSSGNTPIPKNECTLVLHFREMVLKDLLVFRDRIDTVHEGS